MPPSAITPQNGGWALFLDVDGTLLEIAETPQGVHVPDSLKQLLNELSLRLDGALALISGRSITDLDGLFAPLRFCAAGVHGCERREADGRVVHASIDRQRFAQARSELALLVGEHEGLLLEDKIYSLAVHFRRAPHLSAHVHGRLKTVCENMGPGFKLQAGKCVLEIRPSACTKGTSIATFLQQAPFRDRTPIFIGDDVTDEDGFSVINSLGGISIKVGEMASTLARHRLPNVAEVIRWLADVPPPRLADIAV